MRLALHKRNGEAMAMTGKPVDPMDFAYAWNAAIEYERNRAQPEKKATALRMAWDHQHGASLTRFDINGGIITHEEGLTIK